METAARSDDCPAAAAAALPLRDSGKWALDRGAPLGGRERGDGVAGARDRPAGRAKPPAERRRAAGHQGRAERAAPAWGRLPS